MHRRDVHKELYTKDEMRRLISACNIKSWAGLRFRIALIISWRAAVRSDELLSIYPGDIDLDAGTIRIVGKGRKFRTIGFDRKTGEVLREFFAKRAARGFNDNQPLLCSLHGRKASTSWLRSKIKQVAKSAGITKYVHPHGLRHTAAAEMLMDGVDMRTIQKQLGHSKLATTEIYLSRICPKDLIEKIRARPIW